MAGQSQTLYRKWRSQTFSDLVGQDTVVQTLRQSVANGRLTHAYLFCGPRGTGKTSMARLLAKMVNCANPQDGEPCNECLTCREITEGRSTDVFEIDAASNRGIDDIRDLRERVRVVSAPGHTRLFIVDEVHMLTTEAFNALLKTLEEPPPNVIFVLATTEAHKVPATVVSRCTHFEFRRIGLREIIERLRFVCAQEGMQADDAALDVLARAAAGGMRDALSLLDQARAFAGDAITIEAARGMLGMADPALVREVITFVRSGDTAAGLHRINDLAQSGVDLRQLAAQIAEIWRQLMLARAGADVAALLDLTAETAADLKTLSAGFALEDLTECARIFARNDAGARVQVVPQLQLELSFLDCVTAVQHKRQLAAAPEAPSRAAPVAAPAATYQVASDAAPSQQNGQSASSNGRQRPAPSPKEAAPPTVSPPSTEAQPITPSVGTPPITPSVGTQHAAPAPARETPSARRETPPAAAPMAPPTAAPRAAVPADLAAAFVRVQSEWEMIKKVSKQSSFKVAALLASASPVSAEAGTPITIIFAVNAQFHMNKLSQPEYKQNVEWAIAQVTEMTCQARFILESEAQHYAPLVPDAVLPTLTPRPLAPEPAPPPAAATAPPAPEPARPAPATDPQALAAADAVAQALQRDYGARIVEVRSAQA